MRLTLDIDGMSPEAVSRGVEAAERVFDAAGITPEQGAAGAGARDAWDIDGFPDDHPLYNEAAERAVDIWDAAEKAALNACCPDRRDRQIIGHLMLIGTVAQ